MMVLEAGGFYHSHLQWSSIFSNPIMTDKPNDENVQRPDRFLL